MSDELNFFLKGQSPIRLAALLHYSCCCVLHYNSTNIQLSRVVPCPCNAFCNAYGVGLTNFLLAILANNGGVLAGLAACGVTMDVIATAASDLMQDFKTSYCLTLASPRSMFVNQVIGTAMGCVISSCVCGSSSRPSKESVRLEFRVSGSLCACFLQHSDIRRRGPFSTPSTLLKAMCRMLRKKVARFMAMAVPFYVGAYIGINMFIGTVIMFVWGKLDKVKARAHGPAVASGMICGDGIWTLPASILALAGLRPPICMKFLSRETNSRVDQIIAS
ncbi:hypothetical protein Syun_022364 [Stephania yunnanensis]|uniref:Uncharacterized protein n=1 Tax=Stephania yunnanensis TaxID=152371 RepID=A0AAP0FCN6_9MAGN